MGLMSNPATQALRFVYAQPPAAIAPPPGQRQLELSAREE